MVALGQGGKCAGGYIWLKWDTHIYIYTYVQPSDYLGIHAYIPVYTYHLLIHEPQGPRYQIQL